MKVSPEAPKRPHLRYVEGLRATAALVVFVNHAYAQIWNADHGRFAEGALSPFSFSLVAGHLSVTVFIVISGFCLALPVVANGWNLRGGATSFFARRVRRILPPYYAAVALCLALIGTVLSEYTGTIWDVPLQVTRVSVVSHLLLLQDFYATGSINYVFWSIAVEWQIYFFFPLLVSASKRLSPLALAPITIVAGYVVLFSFAATRVARANPHYLGMFTLGMVAAWLIQSAEPQVIRVRNKLPWLAGAALSLATISALCIWWGLSVARERIHYLDLPAGIMTTCILVSASRSEDAGLSRIFSFRPLVFVGTFSYSLYLIHAPMLQLLWRYLLRDRDFSAPAQFAFLMTAGFAIVLAAAYVFFRAFEAPFMRTGEGRRRVGVVLPGA